MRVWTIQTVEVYKKLLQNKELYTDEKLSNYIIDAEKEKKVGCYWTFKESYNWMVSMMDKYNIKGHTEEVNYPWWGWYIYNGKHSKPDLRTTGLGTVGEENYCIELELPEDEVLISDHDMWHCVLNNADIWKGYEEDDNFDRQFDLHEEYIHSMNSNEYQKYKLSTWERILGTYNKPDDFPDGKYKQVTFWKLRLSNVVGAQKFRCR